MKKKEDIRVEKAPEEKADDAASMFMVSSEEKLKEEERAPIMKKRVYRPGVEGDSTKVIESVSKDTEHFRGHEVKVKELPLAKEVEIDASWIEMDVSKDYKIIVKELNRKKVDCYRILGIPSNADTKTIHKAYRKLASQYHPDRGTQISGMTREQSLDMIRDINYSKDILLNPTMRAFHDQAVRERERTEPVEIEPEKPELDENMLDLIRDGSKEDDEAIEGEKPSRTIVMIEDDDSSKKNIGVLLFRKWDEDHEHFSNEFMDYMIQLDEQGYVDYGRMMKDVVDDLDDLYKLKKVSNFSQAANNSLFEIWVKPPYYYIALPVLSREYVQEICDMLKESFNLDSIFFTYP